MKMFWSLKFLLLIFLFFDYNTAHDSCDRTKCEKLCQEQHPIRDTFNGVYGACETVKGIPNFCHCYYYDPLNPNVYHYINDP